MWNSEQISGFLDYLRDIQQCYHMAENDLAEADAATQDILHEIEIHGYDSKRPNKMLKKLRSVRQMRREAKDKLTVTAPVVDWCEKNKHVIKSLERLLGDVRKEERYVQNRTYTPKTDILEEDEK